MQRCDCRVRLGGDLIFTVDKKDVTPAEIVLLRSIHGQDAVINIRPTRQDKTPHFQERERLKAAYGADAVERVFPGYTSKLPTKLTDIEAVEGTMEGQAQEPAEDEPDTYVGLEDDQPLPFSAAKAAAAGEATAA